MTKEELQNKLKQNNLERVGPIVEPHLRNTIRLYLNKIAEEDIGIGQTKIGGRPDLPEHIDWPVETTAPVAQKKSFSFFRKKSPEISRKPLSFVAQINLSEVAGFDTERILPQEGLLFFFYSAEQEAWGFDPRDKDKFKVIFYEGDLSLLRRIDFPSDLQHYARFDACSVTFRQECSLPSYDSPVYDALSDEERDVFYNKIDNDVEINKILGYPDIIQNDMELECELVTNGLYCGNGSGYEDPKRKILEPNAKNWRLLLQIDSNDECGMMWGDVGRLYYWLKKDDLINKQFQHSWLILQCT